MEKPFVICHMLTSLNGKIDGEFFSVSETGTALAAYGDLRSLYGCNAALYGTTTMLGGYAAGRVENLPKTESALPKEDYLAPSEANNYIVSLDPEGILAFNSPYSERKGRAKAHIIEVLTSKVSAEYLSYLRDVGISYIFAGYASFNCSLLLHKLKTMFGIERLMVAGGGITNWSFAAEGLIDELSIVIAPVADGRLHTASVFENVNGNIQTSAFSLKEVKTLYGNVVWLRYEQSQKQKSL